MSKTTRKEEDNSNKPWVSNYPPLKAWLNKIQARCLIQAPYGDPENPRAYFEQWSVNSQVFMVTVQANQGGWSVYTQVDSNLIDATLKDAGDRLGLTEKTA